MDNKKRNIGDEIIQSMQQAIEFMKDYIKIQEQDGEIRISVVPMEPVKISIFDNVNTSDPYIYEKPKQMIDINIYIYQSTKFTEMRSNKILNDNQVHLLSLYNNSLSTEKK
jgi:hypothetical protein